MDVANLVATADQNLFGERAERNSNVGAVVAASEVEFESVVNVGGVVSTRSWQCAVSIKSVLASNFTLSDVFEKRDKLLIDICGESETFEVGREPCVIITVLENIDEVLGRVNV